MRKALVALLALVCVCAMAYGQSKMTQSASDFDDAFLPGDSDTLTFDTRACSQIGWYIRFTGDSVRVAWDYGYLDHWVAIDSTAWADTTDAVEVFDYRQLAHSAIADSDTTATLDGFLYPKMRFRIMNLDAGPYVADTTHVPPTGIDSLAAQDDADTLSGGILYLICGD